MGWGPLARQEGVKKMQEGRKGGRQRQLNVLWMYSNIIDVYVR